MDEGAKSQEIQAALRAEKSKEADFFPSGLQTNKQTKYKNKTKKLTLTIL